MAAFVVLEKSGLMVNVDEIKYVQHVRESDTYKIIFFNHTAMGTNNPTIGKADFYVLNLNLPSCKRTN